MHNDNRPRAGSPPAEEAGSLISAVFGQPSSILNPPVMAPTPVIPQPQPLLESALLPPIVPHPMISPQLSAPSMYQPPSMMPAHMVSQAEDAQRQARRLRREQEHREYAAYEKKKEEARKIGLYLVDDEDDGLNERGIPRGPPKTPPGDPPPDGPEFQHLQNQQMMMPQMRSNLIVIPPEEFDDVSDDSDEPPPKREPIGPRTPPDDGFMPPVPQADRKPASDGELSGDDSETIVKTVKSPEKKKRTRHADVHLKRSSIFSPLRRLYQHRDVHVQPRKRRSDEEKKPEVVKPDNSRELTFPAYATKKCLELLEFTEKKGLTITDDELYEVVREGIELDQAMERILEKKELMKETMEKMRDNEYERIKRIHSNMPRHMQDVLKFDGNTVHINPETVPPVHSMPFGTSSLMSLKYPPAQHMGIPPPGFPPSFAPPIGIPPPSMGMPPPPMGLGPPPFTVPPPVSLLGPPPFNIQPPSHGGNSGNIVPPVVQPIAPPPSIMSENEKRNMITHGLNPLAFSNQPSDFGMPQALKKPQDPQVVRVTNNLSNMLTNALKAQVSKSQSSLASGSPSGTPTKKPVPSLMSINIPGIPKAGTPGSSQN